MLRWEFYPISFLYGLGVRIRNLLFNWGVFKAKEYTIPVIGLGNLSVGGTGKSPHTIYITSLVEKELETAVVSRGYGRKSKGLQIANYNSTYYDIGDEALQIFQRFKNKIIVAVCERRRTAIDFVMKEYNSNLIVLDDCFQHRHVKPGLNILLTAYNHLYVDDYLLPVGQLREPQSGAKRADLVVVTKCPNEISQQEKEEIQKKLNLSSQQQLFFSKIESSKIIYSSNNEMHLNELDEYEVLLVTGIANADSLVNYLQNKTKNLTHLNYKDHHRFKEKDIEEILAKYRELKGNKIILTTEKDFMRLKLFPRILRDLYYLPIQIKMDREEEFNNLIQKYVRKN